MDVTRRVGNPLKNLVIFIYSVATATQNAIASAMVQWVKAYAPQAADFIR